MSERGRRELARADARTRAGRDGGPTERGQRASALRLGAASFRHALLLFGALLMVFPFYWMFTTGFKTFAEAATFPPHLVPETWRFDNWVEAWNAAAWPRAFLNTVFIATAVSLGELVTGALAAYAFARMRWRGGALVFTIFLATLMIPGEATLIPNFVLMSRRFLNLYDTYAAQIVPFLASAFSIFLLRQFFLSIPRELQDAATVDGAGHLRFLWSIALPIVRPALVTVTLIAFLASWNAFLWPLLVTSSAEVRPVQVLMGNFGYENGLTKYHLAMAASSFVILPMLCVYLVAQRYFIEGVARTGIRG